VGRGRGGRRRRGGGGFSFFLCVYFLQKKNLLQQKKKNSISFCFGGVTGDHDSGGTRERLSGLLRKFSASRTSLRSQLPSFSHPLPIASLSIATTTKKTSSQNGYPLLQLPRPRPQGLRRAPRSPRARAPGHQGPVHVQEGRPQEGAFQSFFFSLFSSFSFVFFSSFPRSFERQDAAFPRLNRRIGKSSTITRALAGKGKSRNGRKALRDASEKLNFMPFSLFIVRLRI